MNTTAARRCRLWDGLVLLTVTVAWAAPARAEPKPAATRPTEATDPDLVGGWGADSVTPGSEGVTDRSGNGHAARPVAGKVVVESVDGRRGIRIGRDSRGLSAGSDGVFDMTADFTVALRAKLASDVGDVTLASKWEPGGTGGWAVVHGIRGTGGVGFVAAGNVLVPTPIKAYDAWVHVAVTFKQREFLLYVDGKAIGIREFDVVPPPARAALTFGASARGGMDGWLDDVRIYHRALSAQEVEGLAAGKDPANPYAALTAEDEKRVRDLVAGLAAADYASRERAAAALKGMGRKVFPLLRAHRDAEDPEVAHRVKSILGELPQGEGGK